MTSKIHVDHVQLPIPVGGSAAARRFYEQALGLAERRDPLLDRPGTLRFDLGGQRLDLSEGHYIGVAPQAHLALQVHGLDAVVEQLRRNGHPVDVARLSDGQAYTEDPFGNRIELVAAPEEPELHREPHPVSRLRISL